MVKHMQCCLKFAVRAFHASVSPSPSILGTQILLLSLVLGGNWIKMLFGPKIEWGWRIPLQASLWLIGRFGERKKSILKKIHLGKSVDLLGWHLSSYQEQFPLKQMKSGSDPCLQFQVQYSRDMEYKRVHSPSRGTLFPFYWWKLLHRIWALKAKQLQEGSADSISVNPP